MSSQQPAKKKEKVSLPPSLSPGGSPIAGDGYHRRPREAKVLASGTRRRADTDGKEGKAAPVSGGKSLKYRMQLGGGQARGFIGRGGTATGGRLRYGSTEMGNNS